MDFTIVICDKRAQLSYQFFDLKFGKLGVDKWCPGPEWNKRHKRLINIALVKKEIIQCYYWCY